MLVSKNFLRGLIVVLGICMGLPVWGLSGMVIWGIVVSITTMIFLDLILLRNYPMKFKLVFIAVYAVTMVCVVIWLLSM